MGRYRTRGGMAAATIAAFMAIHVHAETTSTAPTAKSQLAANAENSPNSVPAQTVSTSLPPKKNGGLFQHKSYPDAWTAAQKSNRPILLYVTMPGCPHCEKMIEETYHLPNVEQMVSQSFESVYISRRTHPKLVKSLKVKWYPTTVLVGTNNKVMDVIEGYVDAKTFQRRLKVGLASADSSTQTR
jgi:hypothetical protein